MTLNSQKLVDTFYQYKFNNNPAAITPKFLGDNYTILSLILTFLAGAFVSAYVLQKTVYFSLAPYIFVCLIANELAGFANISVWVIKKDKLRQRSISFLPKSKREDEHDLV